MAARRSHSGIVLLDGEHLLNDALDAGVKVDLVLAESRHAALASRAKRAGATVYEAGASVIDAASPVRSPSGLVALARWHPAASVNILRAEQSLVIGLCGVQDPGNVGSAVRAADALGATGVLALDDSADPAGWKALRGAMGSTFRIPIGTGSASDAVTLAKQAGIQIVATVAGDGVPADQCDLRRPSLLLFGREGPGLSSELQDMADVRATIRMRSRAESLNVAVTTALFLYEARRQRTT